MGCTTSIPTATSTGTTSCTLDPGEVDFEDEECLSAEELAAIMQRRNSMRTLSENLVTENARSKSILDFYTIDYSKILGEGVSGAVVRATHRRSNQQFAVKIVKKSALKYEKRRQLKQEIALMRSLSHPNVLRILEVFESKDKSFMVLELCTGGELLDRLHAQPETRFPESVSARYMRSLISAIRYCHAKKIVHRDLKLENFLFVTDKPDSDIKLIDFGLSQEVKSLDEVLSKPCGTPYYVAPEVLMGRYNAKCDVWSLGVICFMLVSGYPPFSGGTDTEVLMAVRAGRWRFNANPFNSISAECKSFLKLCMTRDVELRPHAEQLMNHKWLQQAGGGGGSADVTTAPPAAPAAAPINTSKKGPARKSVEFKDAVEVQQQPGGEGAPSLSLDVLKRLRRYSRRSSLAKLFLQVVAHTMGQDQIDDLRGDFAKLDPKGRGEITLSDLREALSNSDYSDEEITHIFTSVDYEGLGCIYLHEWIAATLQPSKISPANLQLAFAKIAQNEAHISEVGLTNLLGSTKADIDELTQEADLHSRVIDYDTFKDLINNSVIPQLLSSPSGGGKSPYGKHRKRFSFKEVENEEGSNQ